MIQPCVDEMRRRGTPFSGVVFAGLALTAKGVRVIEFNARFGDPETQSVLRCSKHPAVPASPRRRDRESQGRESARMA